MASSFTWLDHSDKERRKVLEAIDRFREPDTRDELGIGSVRDALADHFFPGTGVLMTRARYFFFVPWMYMSLEKRGPRPGIPKQSRDAEVQLISTLGDLPGTIGKQAKSALKRLPSSIYWLGTNAWGLRTFEGTQSEYHARLESVDSAVAELLEGDDEERMAGARRNWHAAIPRPPKEFPKVADFALTPAEAVFLRERIQFQVPDSLLALMFGDDVPDVDFPWEHPELGSFPSKMKEALHHAQCFAETMQGASLLYNLLLAEAGKRDNIQDLRDQLSQWSAEVNTRASVYASWDVAGFWRWLRLLGNVRDPAVRFVNEWLALRTWQSPARACDDATARALITSREQRLKGPRARLGNPRALELWGGRSGTGRLEYRWRTAKRLVADVLEGLEGNGVADA